MSFPLLFDGDDSDLTPLTDSDFDDSDDSDWEAQKPAPRPKRVSKPVKKPRTQKEKKVDEELPTPKKRRGYKGALQGFQSLPLDLTYEVFGHLHPLDLLHLSRTTKDLRRLLLARSSTSAWIQARRNTLNVPDCPFDLSEPAYASLLFEPVCKYCNSMNVQTIIWEARMRCCKRCGPQMYQYWNNITDVPEILKPIVPSTHEFSTGSIQPHSEKRYCVDIAVNLAAEMKVLSDEEQMVWFWKKKKDHEKRLQHAVLCLAWVKLEHVHRGRQLEQIRMTRRLQILARLLEMGWGDEVLEMPISTFAEHKHVKVPKVLTERAWSKIEADMITFMEETKASRLAKERRQALEKRSTLMKEMYATFVSSQPLAAIIPGIGDLATIPQLRAVLENEDMSAPVSAEDFKIEDHVLLEFVEKWREEKDNELLEIVRQSSVGPSATRDTLLRATTLFNCKGCSTPISYPRVLIHTCNNRNNILPDSATIFQRLRSEPWNAGGDRITFHEAAHKRTKYILDALKLSQSTTFEQMKELNPFVECFCSSCYKPSATIVTRTCARWEHMIEHTPRYTIARVTRPYGALDAPTSTIAAKQERNELTKLRKDHDWSDYSYRSYCCMHCHHRDTRRSMEAHARTSHSVAQPAFDLDYTYHTDARVSLRAPYVYMKATPRPAAPKATVAVAPDSSPSVSDDPRANIELSDGEDGVSHPPSNLSAMPTVFDIGSSSA